HGLAQQHPDGGNGQAGEAADGGATGGATTPGDGQHQHREVGARGDGEGQAHHEGHVLVLEDDTQQDGQDAQGQRGDLGDAHFLCFGGAPLGDHVGVQVVGDGGGASQGQTGNHGHDGGEGHGGQEAQQQAATHGVGQVHGGHVGATDQVVQHVEAAVRAHVE